MRRSLVATSILLAGVLAAFVVPRSAPLSAQTTIPIGVDAYTNHISSEPAGLTYVYKYIVPGGQSIVSSYINTAYANGKKPVLVVYTNYDSTSPDWGTWDGVMNAVRADGRDVDVVVEPDLFGYIRNQNGCGTTGKQMVDRFLSTAPTNAHLGFFISPWMLPYTTPAADAAAWKSCWQAAGGERMEDIYVDVTDRDQEYKGTYPWSASKIQMYEDWFKALSQATGRKIGVWQIPLGNSQCLNGRRSTFVESWLVEGKLMELSPYVEKLLFGPGIEDYDTANTQSWNLPQHVKYECGLFNSRVTSLSGGSSGTPTVGPTATRTPSAMVTPSPGSTDCPDTNLDGWVDAGDVGQIARNFGDRGEDSSAVLSAHIDASQTNLTVTDRSMFVVGDTIAIEGEQMRVTALRYWSPDTVTVTRAVNGTHGASHETADSIYRATVDGNLDGVKGYTGALDVNPDGYIDSGDLRMIRRSMVRQCSAP